MNKPIIALTLGAAILVLSGQALASGDAANGAALAKKYNCASCHGADFKTPIDPSYPKLAGQHADYLVHALTAYKRGTKVANGRSNPIMAGMAQPLSDRDMADIAAYLESLPGPLVTKR
ncbi:cytochrome c [Massilia sp. Root335]|jgi:cytochrome c553|uniref:c-type cytochrome n=1 Tax=Massilia sp. Root335 TaxID=1736517 RepID=UPI000701CE57|nr:cytochrome c [Massilia sp. Root335]KQV32851.1 cytochrome C [Massilia sp. Root335]